MEISGEQRIAASRERVWNALNNPEILRRCIPGCQELDKLSDTEMTAVAVIKVGPVSARFRGAVTLSELDPPNGYKITGEGQGGVAGFANGSAEVRLTQDGDDTILNYVVSAQIGGKLAQLGGRLIDATARKMSDNFFRKFSEETTLPRNGSSTHIDQPNQRLSEGHAHAGMIAPPPQTGQERGITTIQTGQAAWLQIGLWINTAALIMAAISIVWMLDKEHKIHMLPQSSADFISDDIFALSLFGILILFGYILGVYNCKKIFNE